MGPETTAIFIRTAGALALILACILVVLFGIRHWGARLQGGKDNLIEVVSTRMILPRKHLCVVRVGNRLLLLGASENALALLSVLDTERPETEIGDHAKTKCV